MPATWLARTSQQRPWKRCVVRRDLRGRPAHKVKLDPKGLRDQWEMLALRVLRGRKAFLVSRESKESLARKDQ